METDEQGFSAKKVVAGAALGVAVPAAVAVAKRFAGGNGDGASGDDAQEQDDQGARDEPISRERKGTTRGAKKTTRTATKRTRTAAKRTTTATKRTSTRTREQLYKQATRLKIEGRSSMNKEQLERAVNRAKQKASR